MKKGGTGLHKAIREINLVYKGLTEVPALQGHARALELVSLSPAANDHMCCRDPAGPCVRLTPSK